MNNYELSGQMKSMLFFLFTLTALIGPGIQYNKLYLFHVIFISCLPFVFFKIAANWKSSRFFLLFLLYCTLSLTWSLELAYGTKLTFVIFFCFLIIAILREWRISREEKLKIFLKCLQIIFIIQLAIGLAESFTSFRYPLSKLSAYNHWFGINYYTPDFMVDDAISKNLATGLSWNPNQYSLFLTIFFPFLFLLKNRIIKILLIVISLYVIVHNSSRGCILALIAELLIVLLLYLRFYKMSVIRKRIIFTSFSVVSIYVIYTKLFTKAAEFLANFNILGFSFPTPVTVLPGDRKWLTNDEMRISWLINSFNAFLDNFLIGLGLGSAGSPKVQKLMYESGPETIRSIHLFWLELLTDLGLLGFTPLVIALCWLLYKLLKKIDKNEDKYEVNFGICFIASILAFCFACISISSAFYNLPMYLLISFSLIFISKEKYYSNDNSTF